jgi:putative restriction endonuclease
MSFSHTPDILPSLGKTHLSRRELHDAGIHRGLMRGIAPQGLSIVLSGGYVDDQDLGDEIIYTGEGGRDADTGGQIADQTLSRGNLYLAQNCQKGIPVIRA